MKEFFDLIGISHVHSSINLHFTCEFSGRYRFKCRTEGVFSRHTHRANQPSPQKAELPYANEPFCGHFFSVIFDFDSGLYLNDQGY